MKSHSHRMRVPALAFVIASLLSTPAQADQHTPPAARSDGYALGAVKADFAVARKIGSKRAGLLCLPAGSFRWRDARSGMDGGVSAVAAVLRRAIPDRFADAQADDDIPRRYRIVATVEDFSIDGCVKTWGLAAAVTKRKVLSGHATISVRWDVTDRITGKTLPPTTLETAYDFTPDVEGAADALTLGLQRSAAEFALANRSTPEKTAR